MKETEFKVLEYCGMYVDTPLLGKGIYTTNIPKLYSKEKTLADLVNDAETVKDMSGEFTYITDEYINNLKQCKLNYLKVYNEVS